VLTYALAHEEDPLGEVELWYDPSTYKVLKRAIHNPQKYGGGVLEETYACTYDVEIQASAFDLGSVGK